MSDKPQWWSKAHDLSWEKLKTSLVADWQKVTEGAGKLEKQLQERALAFGHGAQDVYAKVNQWSNDLEQKLKADWDKTQHKADETWDKVRDAVKLGWEKTRTTVAAAKGKSN